MITMLKTAKRMLLLLLSVVLVSVCAVVSVSADSDSAQAPQVLTYTYTEDAPTVFPTEIFINIYETLCDIQIDGIGAVWYFNYENVFLSTERWREFSSLVTVRPLSETAAAKEIVDALQGTASYLIDMKDGDSYPGTATVFFEVGDVVDASLSYTIYEYLPNEDGSASLAEVVRSIRPDDDGVISFALTEAHDFLMVQTTAETKTALSAYAYVPRIDVAENDFFAGVDLKWIVFFSLIGMAFVVFLIVLLVRRTKKTRVKQSQQKQDTKKRKK